MSLYKVESNVPLPKKAASPGAPTKYPFADMKVGQSFFVPEKDTSPKNVRASASLAQKRCKARFSVRTMKNGVRVFRVA
jgi:hypothetical protein